MKEIIRQEEIINVISRQISQYNLAEVSKIRFKVGRLTSITEKMLADFFILAVNGRKMRSKIEIEIEWVPASLKCNACQRVASGGYVCPECGSEDLKIISGEEFCIEDVLCQ